MSQKAEATKVTIHSREYLWPNGFITNVYNVIELFKDAADDSITLLSKDRTVTVIKPYWLQVRMYAPGQELCHNDSVAKSNNCDSVAKSNNCTPG